MISLKLVRCTEWMVPISFKAIFNHWYGCLSNLTGSVFFQVSIKLDLLWFHRMSTKLDYLHWMQQIFSNVFQTWLDMLSFLNVYQTWLDMLFFPNNYQIWLDMLLFFQMSIKLDWICYLFRMSIKLDWICFFPPMSIKLDWIFYFF